MKVKTSELSGVQLDWLVARCEGIHLIADFAQYKPSTDWAQGGPIIEREKINLEWRGEWRARLWADSDEVFVGPTSLVAAMRCYVASKLGDEVGIPEELKGETA